MRELMGLLTLKKPTFSKKGQELINLYEKMAKEGYFRSNQERVEVAFSDFELRAYRNELRVLFEEQSIRSVLDYGCGGSDWLAKGFDEATGQSALAFFNLHHAYRYEPARNLDERQAVDCVISFDVLEHIFIADVPKVLRDMFTHATKLLVLNIACYPAVAQLPNGENAHITVREPAWWKGMVDSISVEYPDISVYLVCSTAWRESKAFALWNAGGWQEGNTFVIDA